MWARGIETGAQELILDTGRHGGGRLFTEIFVKAAAAATFEIWQSLDGVTWRLKDSIILAAAGEDWFSGFNGWQYIKVVTAYTGANEIEIGVSR